MVIGCGLGLKYSWRLETERNALRAVVVFSDAEVSMTWGFASPVTRCTVYCVCDMYAFDR